MPTEPIHLVLADDDIDDTTLFQEALREISIPFRMTTVHDGEQLMNLLTKTLKDNNPRVIFLDLNMPRKNGFECLTEIKTNEKLKDIPIVIVSTTFQNEVVKLLYKNGAHYYICKPDEFNLLKKVIWGALTEILKANNLTQPAPEDFVLSR
jgi:CheY-like chemotaxis protein